MTDQLKKVLDWLYLGPNPHANSYFRRDIVTSQAITDKDAAPEDGDEARFCETPAGRDERVVQK